MPRGWRSYVDDCESVLQMWARCLKRAARLRLKTSLSADSHGMRTLACEASRCPTEAADVLLLLTNRTARLFLCFSSALGAVLNVWL